MRQAPSARATWPSCTGLASASRTTGAEWKRIPTGKPSARCWNWVPAVMADGAYLVATPAVKRPWTAKYRWNSAGSTPFPSASPDSFGGALNMRANSRSKVDELLRDHLTFRGVGVQELQP